jgi:hypothetical protein
VISLLKLIATSSVEEVQAAADCVVNWKLGCAPRDTALAEQKKGAVKRATIGTLNRPIFLIIQY